jgi:hypothetical protein
MVAGKVYEVDAAFAKPLIDGGYAEAVGTEKPTVKASKPTKEPEKDPAKESGE